MKLLVVGNASSSHVADRAGAVAAAGATTLLASTAPCEVDGVKSIPLPSAPVGSGITALFNKFRWAWRVFRLFRGLRYDAVHIHFARSLPAYLAFLASRSPLAISTMGGDVLFDERPDIHISLIERKLLTHMLCSAHLVTVKTEQMREVTTRLGVDPALTRKVTWGIDNTRFHPIDKTDAQRLMGLSSDTGPIIFSPRNAQPFYNIHLIIRAFAKIKASWTSAKLLVAGQSADADYIAELVTLAQKLNIQKDVIFLERLPLERMPTAYNAADVVISLAPSDGMPQTIFESLACGTPIILSDLSQYKEIVRDGQSALICPIDPEQVAFATHQLLSDSNLRNSFRSNGLKIISQQMDLTHQANRMVGLLEHLSHSPPNKRPFSRAIGALLFLAYLTRPIWRRLRLGRHNASRIN